MRIDDKAIVLSDLVVKCAASFVACLRLPVDARASCGPCRVIHGFNQSPPDALAANLFGGEKVLQIANVVQARRAAMEYAMNQADQDAGIVRNEGAHWLARGEKSLPGGCGDCLGKRCRTATPIEGVIPIP